MHKMFRTAILVTFGLLISGIISGCTDYDRVARVGEPEKISLLATSPKNGGKILLNGELKLVFDNPPKSVTVDGRPAIIQDNTAIVKIADLPKVTPGTKRTAIITWRNSDNFLVGVKTITFTVLKPVADSPQSDDRTDDKLPNATKVTLSPGAGVTISSNQHFTLIFDQNIAAATVNGITATRLGRNWTVLPVLPIGTATLNVKWTNRDGSTGSKVVGPYVVEDSSDDGVRTPPATAVWVDPVPGTTLLPDQLFTLTFNQEVVEATVDRTPATGSGNNWTAQPILPTPSELRQRRDRLVESYNRVPAQMSDQTRRMLQDFEAGRIYLTIWWRNSKRQHRFYEPLGPLLFLSPTVFHLPQQR